MTVKKQKLTHSQPKYNCDACMQYMLASMREYPEENPFSMHKFELADEKLQQICLNLMKNIYEQYGKNTRK